MIRIRAGIALLLSAPLLAGGAQAAPAQDLIGQSAVGTTGAQQSTSCPTPKLSGLPKRPKFTNATIHFKITNVTPGSTYLITAGQGEVLGGVASESTIKSSFLLPDQGTVDKQIPIQAVLHVDQCDNAPWKLKKRIEYNAVTPDTPATPAAPPTPATAAPPVGSPGAAAPINPVKPLKLPKPLKPITQRLPVNNSPANRLTWLTPIDGGARLDTKLTEPELARLDRNSDKANSTNALFGLGIVGAVFAIAAIGGFAAFRHRDEVQFERAMTEQLKHLEEGDPGMEFAEEPDTAPMAPAEEAPFADEDPAPPSETRAAEAAQAALVNGAAADRPVLEPHHRAEVEAELQRILTEAGLEAELDGILGDARVEAERHGIALDPDLMLQALCEEINGSAMLSDARRAELRDMFAGIIAEEAQHLPAEPEKVPTQ